jgi:hypothetical protein
MKDCLCWLEETRLQGGDEGPCDGGDDDNNKADHEKTLRFKQKYQRKAILSPQLIIGLILFTHELRRKGVVL